MSNQSYRFGFFRRKYHHTASVAPPEVKILFESYSEKGVMSVDHLLRFLTDVQKQEKATREEAQAIVNALSSLLHRNCIHLDAFFKYLFGVDNSPLASHEVIYSILLFNFSYRYWFLNFFFFSFCRCIKTWMIHCHIISYSQGIIRIWRVTSWVVTAVKYL